jgi:hypothetical protein
MQKTDGKSSKKRPRVSVSQTTPRRPKHAQLNGLRLNLLGLTTPSLVISVLKMTKFDFFCLHFDQV